MSERVLTYYHMMGRAEGEEERGRWKGLASKSHFV